MSILEYNGAAVCAMTGKNCVAIAADKRLGIRFQTVSCDFQKIFPMGKKVMIGLPGLATDVITFSNELKFHTNLYQLSENRELAPKTFVSMVSNFLYNRRFGPYFVEPIIAGLDPKTDEPFIASMDLIGCPMVTDDFVVGGTCDEQLYGMCETLYKKDMQPDELFETISQCLLNAQDRDAYSGWGGVVYVIEPNKITRRDLKARMD